MNEFVKKMLELGAELDQTASPIEATMIINDAEILYRNEIKALTIPDVSQQRELLKAFQDHYQSNKFDDERTFDWNIDNFLKAFNCG